MSICLVFDGDIDLMGSRDPAGWSITAVEGTQFGNAEPVEQVVSSLLKDGAVIATTGYQNREASILVQIKGSDSEALADGHARLARATGRMSTLEYRPPDGGPVTVFKVMTSSLARPEFDDLAEVRNERTYVLRLVCEPFTRSADLVIDAAGTAPSTGMIVDACESTTGWTASGTTAVDSTVFASGTGSVRCQSGAVSNVYDSNWGYYASAGNVDTKALSVATGTGGYFSVLIRMDWPNGYRVFPSSVTSIHMTANGVRSPVSYATSEQLPDGWVRYVWSVPASVTITLLEFAVTQRRSRGPSETPARPNVRYDAFTLSTTATTSRQIVKTLDVKGSARAPGSLHVAAPTETVGLGGVLLITVPEADLGPGFQPDVRRWVTAGTTTSDATALHGSYYQAPGSYGATVQFELPANLLRTGWYTAVALVKNASSASFTFGIEARTTIGNTGVGPVSSVERTLGGMPDWGFAALGQVYLPPTPVDQGTSTAEVRLRPRASGANFSDIFLIPAGADYTIIDAGTGTAADSGPASHIWLDSPDPAQPRGGYWMGNAENRVNARWVADPALKWGGSHYFKPGPLKAFLVTTGAQGPRLDLAYFPHWLDAVGS